MSVEQVYVSVIDSCDDPVTQTQRIIERIASRSAKDQCLAQRRLNTFGPNA